MFDIRCSLLLLPILVAACAAPQRRFVRAEGRWLRDPQGRVLILHGVNVASASKRPPYLPWQSRDEFEQIARWGFNSVRLLTVWAAVEPEPGRYDDAYIERLAERVRWCRELGLHVILDMHQDLYSEKYGGDGAPAWACLDDGLAMGPRNPTWFLNALQPPVIRAFDRFWQNAPGPGGVGLQDRFAAAWQHLARRFRDEPAVVGYDLLNEPYPSTATQATILSYANAAAKLTAADARMKLLAALASRDTHARFAELAAPFRDPKLALRLVHEGGGPIVRFERERLLPLYERTIAAIREVDPHHICFIEPTPVGGAVWTGLRRPADASGRPFANVAFAPHYYEIATELRLPYEKSRERMHALVGRIAANARDLDMPVWLGEWGNVPANLEGGRECIRDALDACDAHLASWCYWEYGRAFPKLPHLGLLTRPYPQAVAGTPMRLVVDDHKLVLEIEDVVPSVETVVWLPPDVEATATIDAGGHRKIEWHRREDGTLAIRCGRRTQHMVLSLRY